MTEHQTGELQAAHGSPLLIASLFRAAMATATTQEIIYADRRRFSYVEFGERVHQLAAALTRLGVRPGSTVGVMDWDTHRYLECFFAVPMMGAALHTINVRLSAEQILYTINHAQDDVILVNHEFLPLLERMWDRIDPGKSLVLLNDADEVPASILPLVGEYEALLAGASSDFTFPNIDENTRATIFYTTGTTGLPKGVYFSHRQLVLHTLVSRGAFCGKGQGRFNEGDVYMPVTPMFHVHAWGLPYVATLLGVKQVYPGRYHPDTLMDLIEREGVTFSHCVPTILQMILASAEKRQSRLDGWTVVIGGAALPLTLCKQAMAMGIDIFAGYGMSETGPILTLAQLRPEMRGWDMDAQAEIRCKTGRTIPLVHLRIVDAEMRDVPHDGVAAGEIIVRAPWLTEAYLKDPANSQALWAGGWLHTGDIGVIDKRGYLKITDRLKDVIKSGGEWVSSIDVEDLIQRHPAVAEVAVIGIPDAKWSERPVAIIVLRPGQEASVDEIKQHLQGFVAKGLISAFAIPAQVKFVADLPRTSVGKLNKRVLREDFNV
jgi:fatty-acyl-CoA synthase